MTHLAWYFGAEAAAICAATLAWIGRGRRGGFVALLAVAVLLPLLYGGGVDLLGRPRPAVLMPWRIADARIAAYLPNPGVAIYVWVVTPDADEPLALTLPWSDKTAQALGAAMAAAASGGTDVHAGSLGGFRAMGDAAGGRRMFWAAPQAPSPDKPSPPAVNGSGTIQGAIP